MPDSSNSAAELLNSIPSIVDSENNIILRGRVKSAAEVVSDYRSLFNDDWAASRDRAIMQSMVDGNPPYSDARDRMMGYFGRTNVNWGLLTKAHRNGVMPYTDILDSMDNFGIIPIKPGYANEQERNLWEPVIAEELHRMITHWREFLINWQLKASYYWMWGAAFTFRDDSLDWRWRVENLQNLKMPRGTRASLNNLDRITCRVQMNPGELYAKIGDTPETEELARRAGWNPEAVKQACKNAHPKAMPTDDPEDMQAMWKDNSINSGNTALIVELVHEWVQEMDGTVSHYIADYLTQTQNNATQDFLYKKEGEYESMSALVNAYTNGVGTNGDIHSVRGEAYFLFQSAQAYNRLLCKFLDKSIEESNTYIQATGEDSINELAIRPRGPLVEITNGVEFVERRAPNVANSLVQSLDAIQGIFQVQSSGVAAGAGAAIDRGQKTKYELQRRDEMEGRLSSGTIGLFFRAWEEDYRTVAIRVTNPELQPEHPGGAEAFDFRARCIERGVPEEVLLNGLDFDNIQINMGIGKGSTAERRSTLDFLNASVYQRLDAEGQATLTRDTVASYTNARYARLLVPVQPNLRPPLDQQIANMENQLMSAPSLKMAVIEPNQNHIVHCQTHIESLQQDNQQLADQQVELQDIIPQMQLKSQHAGEHLQFIDPMDPRAKMFKEALQQFNEVITNGAKHVEAEQRKMEKAQAEGLEMPETEGTPQGVFARSVDAAARMESLMGSQKLEQQQLEFRQKLAFRDAEAAQKLRHQEAMLQIERAKKAQAVTRT